MARKKSKAELRDAAKSRPPLRIEAIEPDVENLTIHRNGELRAAARVILHQDDVPALRAGYYCANCLEAQHEAFPEKCWLCGFSMRDKQTELLAKGYQGNIRLGPTTTADTELAAMQEWAERRKLKERDEIHRPRQVLLPGKDF